MRRIRQGLGPLYRKLTGVAAAEAREPGPSGAVARDRRYLLPAPADYARPAEPARSAYLRSLSMHEASFGYVLLDRLDDTGEPTSIARHPRKALLTTTRRSGSTYLASAMADHGLWMKELFIPYDPVVRMIRRHKLTTLQQYSDLLVKRRERNGMFGVKVMYNQLQYIAAMEGSIDCLGGWKLVHLTRLNLVRQAISYMVALKTAQWSSRAADPVQLTDDDYDFDRIMRLIARLTEENGAWERHFAIFGHEPFRIVYEDVVADKATWLPRIAAAFGVPEDAAPIERPVSFERQSTDLNTRWEARFREEARRRGREEYLALLTAAQG